MEWNMDSVTTDVWNGDRDVIFSTVLSNIHQNYNQDRDDHSEFRPFLTIKHVIGAKMQPCCMVHIVLFLLVDVTANFSSNII